MSILDEIVAHKRVEVNGQKRRCPVKSLEQSAFFERPIFSMTAFLRRPDQSGIIAEFKRRSPSRGVINPNASVEQTTSGYVAAGASALSVLTDFKFFGGSNDDLVAARNANACPIIRKDFTIDEYQVIEARSIGADAILIIAAAMKPAECKSLTELAHSLGLEVLLEVHDEVELSSNLDSGADLIGVNNRNLKTFEVSIETSRRLAKSIPSNCVAVSESGISSPSAIHELRALGYEGFLIGEEFMKYPRPDEAAREFIGKVGRRGPDKPGSGS